MLADDEGSLPCLCPGTSQVQEPTCRSQEPGQNAANISSWEKACGTHPTGWERPQASTETLWLKASGSFSFFVALESSCRRHSRGKGGCSWLCCWTVYWCFGTRICSQHHRGGEGACTHSQWCPETPVSPHLFSHVLSPARPWPFMGHWCKWGLICPSTDESAGTFLWWIYCLVVCGFVMGFFL